MQIIRIAFIAAFTAIAAPAPAPAQTLPTTTEQVFAEFGEKVGREDFSGLDAMYETYIRTKAKTSDGVFLKTRYQDALHVLGSAIEHAAEQKKAPGEASGKIAKQGSAKKAQANKAPEVFDRVKAAETFAAKWVKHNPKSAPGHFAVAHAIIESGWKARGGSYADKVTEAGWTAFRIAGIRARNYLETQAAFANDDGNWHALMIEAVVAEEFDVEKLVGAYLRGLDVDPQNFRLHQTMHRYLRPEWGGDANAIGATIDEAVARMQGEEAVEYYARLRWLAALIDKTPAAEQVIGEKRQHWSRVREGFDVIVKKYPTPWNMNHFARFACIAGDMKTAARVYEMMGPEKIIPELWKDFAYPCVVPYHPDILAKLRSAAATPVKDNTAADIPALRK